MLVAPQDFEAAWWGNCANTYGEETKQTVYARFMGLNLVDRGGPGPIIDLDGRSVVDVGGGPASLLLKAVNGERHVVDPCPYPAWVKKRYEAAGVYFHQLPGESAATPVCDETWIYNVLQHVEDPQQVIRNARRGQVLRLFEWLDIPPHEGHPHELTAPVLDAWCGGGGTVHELNERGCVGRALSGTYSGRRL